MDSRFPGYFGVQMERAKTALQQDEWSKAVSILEAIPLDSIDKGSARHVCHMLGVGLFAEGEVQKALDVWTKGMAFGPGRCPLEKLAEYARLSLMPAKKRRREKNALADLLNLFETVDGHLSSRRWSEAIEAMERTGALATKEIQLEARLAYAYLNLKEVGDNGMRRLCKMLALATFCTMRPSEHVYLLFPPFVEIWPPGTVGKPGGRSEKMAGRLGCPKAYKKQKARVACLIIHIVVESLSTHNTRDAEKWTNIPIISNPRHSKCRIERISLPKSVAY